MKKTLLFITVIFLFGCSSKEITKETSSVLDSTFVTKVPIKIELPKSTIILTKVDIKSLSKEDSVINEKKEVYQTRDGRKIVTVDKTDPKNPIAILNQMLGDSINVLVDQINRLRQEKINKETVDYKTSLKEMVFYGVVGVAVFIIVVGLLVFAVKSMKIF